jgi:hypothetical protein
MFILPKTIALELFFWYNMKEEVFAATIAHRFAQKSQHSKARTRKNQTSG